MKSNKIFFFSLLSLLIIVWIISLALHKDLSQLSQKDSIIMQVFTSIFGIIMMRFTLGKVEFKPFCWIYGSVLIILFFLILISYLFPIFSFRNHYFHTIHLSTYYTGFTFLNTPLPFIFYWVFLKAFGSSKDSQQDN